MKIYLVGGAVRDKLLGREPSDCDWVVVGGTRERMLELGFSQVGADFPVFLHPDTKEEYALARQERKAGPGRRGFETSFDSSTSLEEDLRRRDLTINAMAWDMENDCLVDPYGGQRDLEQGVLRHVSDAFSEDPLRVFRLARFMARTGFRCDGGTLAFCSEICSSGALKEVSGERFFAELSKMSKEARFWKGMDFLAGCGALGYFSADWERGWMALDPQEKQGACEGLPAHWRPAFAAASTLGSAEELCVALRFDRQTTALAKRLSRAAQGALRAAREGLGKAEALLDFYESCALGKAQAGDERLYWACAGALVRRGPAGAALAFSPSEAGSFALAVSQADLKKAAAGQADPAEAVRRAKLEAARMWQQSRIAAPQGRAPGKQGRR